MAQNKSAAHSKVPQVTLIFWIIKILATTVGETGGDALSMTLNLGYAASSLIFLAFFCVALFFQIGTKKYHPFAYWSVVVATTTVGTTTSDFFDRTLAMGYVKSSIILFCLVIAVLFVWRKVTGEIKYENISSPIHETFYWVTILISNTLGTALGDFVATTAGIGFEKGALVFGGLLLLVGITHYLTRLPKAVVFWAAYVLTRPLGATVGDVLTKSHAEGGLAIGRFYSTFTIAAVMVVMIIATSRTKNPTRDPSRWIA